MAAASARYENVYHKIEGPVSPFIKSFVSSLERQQFSSRSINRQLCVVASFSNWLQSQNVTTNELSFEHQQQFFQCQHYRCSISTGYVAAINRLLGHLHGLGVTTSSVPRVDEKSSVDRAVATYAQYLRTTIGLTELSIAKYRAIVQNFLLDHFEGENPKCSELNATDVMSYFTKIAPTISVSLAKSTATAIRSYMRYLVYSGCISRDLAGAVPTMPNWSLCDIPRSISAENAKQAIDHCPKHTAIGLRDYAILLLLARLGLRSSEIVSLTLDSIDWDCSSLSFIGKGKEPAVLPITAEVGDALARYIQHGRPTCQSRALFLRTMAPIQGLGAPTTVSTIVRSAITRAGITTSNHGAHQFRHALATSMINNGATLNEISSVLRHRKSKTTQLYAKVDFGSLRALCLPMPGEDK